MSPENARRISEGFVRMQRINQELVGSMKSGAMLSQSCFYQIAHGKDSEDGFWYKSTAAWWYEVGLTKKELRKAREDCSPYVETKRKGSPPKLFYRVKKEALESAIE